MASLKKNCQKVWNWFHSRNKFNITWVILIFVLKKKYPYSYPYLIPQSTYNWRFDGKSKFLHRSLYHFGLFRRPKKNFTKFKFWRHFCYKIFSFWTTFISGILPKNENLKKFWRKQLIAFCRFGWYRGRKKNFTETKFGWHFSYKNFSFWAMFISGILLKNQNLKKNFLIAQNFFTFFAPEASFFNPRRNPLSIW